MPDTDAPVATPPDLTEARDPAPPDPADAAAPAPVPSDEPAAGPPEPVPVAAVEPDPLTGFRGELTAVRDELAALRAQFDEKILRDRGQQQVIDKLHAALKEAQADLVWGIRRPILAEIVQWHDDLAAEVARDPGSATVRRFLQDALDLLFRLGVHPYQADGDRFDPRSQKARKFIPPPAPDAAHTVAARVRPGFRTDRHTLRLEVVDVYGPFTPQPPAAEGATP